MKKLTELLDLLALHGGTIVSTASLTVEDINQAHESGRMYVQEGGLGFVWMPNILNFPATTEELNQFNQWYPLNTPFPESLKLKICKNIINKL